MGGYRVLEIKGDSSLYGITDYKEMRRDMKNHSEVNIHALFTNRLSYGRSVQPAASISPRPTVTPLSYHSMQCSVGILTI